MNTSVNKIFLTRKATVYTALMFALAMLVLIVSCPVKRLLLTNFNSSASSSQKNNQNIYHSANLENNAAANCSIVNDKSVVIKSDVLQQHILHLPFYISNINNKAGFNINYFLSGISYNSTQSIASQHTTLPLFLQHLRLLI